MSVPKRPDDINKDWLKAVLKSHGNEADEVIALDEIKDNEGLLSGAFK